MSLSTVSKSLKALEEDLIIDRKGAIRLLQPDKLLEKLSQNYASPNINERIRMKVQAEPETLRQLLRRQSQELGLPVVASGISSVGQYAVMQRGVLLSVYCPSLEIGIGPKMQTRTSDDTMPLICTRSLPRRLKMNGHMPSNCEIKTEASLA